MSKRFEHSTLRQSWDKTNEDRIKYQSSCNRSEEIRQAYMLQKKEERGIAIQELKEFKGLLEDSFSNSSC